MQEIIKKYNIKAKKDLGQNFLMNETILDKICELSNIKQENILEVWPWFWALTKKIIDKNPKSLKLIELDKDMINILNDRKKSWDFNLENIDFSIENIDILKFDPEFEKYKVIANIPYYITSPILSRFFYDVKNKPSEMIILMQKEVWDRIVSNKSSVLSLFIKKKSVVSSEIFVPSKDFSPAPKVDSSVLYFKYIDKYENIDDQKFLTLIKKAFSQPRKKVINNLTNSWYSKDKLELFFTKNWLVLTSRPEDLSLDNYINLIQEIG